MTSILPFYIKLVSHAHVTWPFSRPFVGGPFVARRFVGRPFVGRNKRIVLNMGPWPSFWAMSLCLQSEHTSENVAAIERGLLHEKPCSCTCR